MPAKIFAWGKKEKINIQTENWTKLISPTAATLSIRGEKSSFRGNVKNKVTVFSLPRLRSDRECKHCVRGPVISCNPIPATKNRFPPFESSRDSLSTSGL